MAGSNGFLQWNPAENNMETDAQYLADSMRLNGATAQIYPSNLHNKFAYQVTTFMNALAQMLANKGYSLDDSSLSSLINVFNSSLNNKEWLPSTSYGVGDVVDSAALPQWAQAVCSVAGTSSTSEPTWGTTAGATISDGGVTWILIAKQNNIGRNQQIYTTGGSYTFTAPINGLYKVTVVGGGGAGGSATGTSTGAGAGGGGGAGGAAIKKVYLTKGATVAVVVAATSTGNGNSSSFGAYCSASGGTKGTNGIGAASFPDANIGGPGGIGSDGDLNIRGDCGKASIYEYLGVNTQPIAGGAGGNSIYFGGAPYTASSGVATGAAGLLGGGGSGGSSNTTTSYLGGNGAAGVVIVEW